MKSFKRQAVLGVISGIGAIAAAIVVANVAGIHIQSSSAAGPTNNPAPVPIPPSSTSTGFSALNSASLSPPPGEVIAKLQSMHPGTYASARRVGDGMYIAENNGAICMWVDNGLGGCTDRLNAGDAWLAGDMGREFDSETAPLQIHLYGIARDTVASFSFVLENGSTVTAPVTNDAFSVTVPNTAFSDIRAITENYADGRAVALAPSTYYPQTLPVVKP
jgi:hypothetical protein